MKYHEINDMQKKHIMSQCSTDFRFDWQDKNMAGEMCVIA